MTRRLLLLAVILASAAGVGATPRQRGLPMSGTVQTLAGLPVASANVLLVRRYWRDGGASEGTQIVARSTTDAMGVFEFGPIDLKTEIAFPLETGAQFEYSVTTGSRQRTVHEINFTAPRADCALQSVRAKITVY